MRMRILDPGSFRPWIQDPGWKISDPGSGINITDPLHWQKRRCHTFTWFCPKVIIAIFG
jgi:hypothetical protein